MKRAGKWARPLGMDKPVVVAALLNLDRTDPEPVQGRFTNRNCLYAGVAEFRSAVRLTIFLLVPVSRSISLRTASMPKIL
jgi:hypothetical protein